MDRPSGSLINIPVRRRRRSLEETKTGGHIVNGRIPQYERLTPDTVAELPRALPLGTMELAPPPLTARRTIRK